jgi:hypothetical protein
MTKFILSTFVISSALTLPVRSVEANPQFSPEACSRSCSAGCVEFAQSLQSTGQAILASCGVVPPPPPPVGPNRPGNRPPPPRRQQVELFEDDDCKDDLVAVLKEWTDCSQFSKPDARVWGVRVDGVCYNVKDTTLGKACVAFSDFGSRRSVEFYNDDECDRDLLGVVASKARCSELAKSSGSSSRNVYAVRINGVCQDVSDMTIAEACERYVP